jgi:hypothetical protein
VPNGQSANHFLKEETYMQFNKRCTHVMLVCACALFTSAGAAAMSSTQPINQKAHINMLLQPSANAWSRQVKTPGDADGDPTLPELFCQDMEWCQM